MANRSDNFNHTDGFLNGVTPSDGGSAWVAQHGSPAIFSNQAYGAGGGQTLTTLDSGTADVEVQVTVAVVGDAFGVIARLTDDQNYIRWCTFGGSYNLGKYVANSFTSIYTGPTPANGDVLKMQLIGSTVKVYLNGVQQGADQTITDFTSNTLHGIIAGDNTGRLDDYSSADASSTSDTPELYGTPFGSRGQRQMAQLLSQ